MSAPRTIDVRRDKAVEVFVYTVTLALLVVVIIGSHLVVWDDMNQREVLRMRRARKGTMPISSMAPDTLCVVGTSQTQLMKSQWRLSDAGSIPAASTIHGGALVSTGDEGAMETAEARGLANQPETNKRQLRVADGGLTAPAHAGSASQRNQLQPYEPLALRAAALCGLEDQGLSVFFAIISRESTWRMYDKQGRVLRSHSGALGLTQIKPATAREMGTSDPHTPWGNLLLGACYLRKQYDRFGTWERAVLAYRVGPKGVATAEARRYVDDVMEGAE